MAKYSCPGILPCIIYPSTAKAAASELLANVEGTNASVVACAGLDDTTRSNWTTFYSTVKPFLQEDPGLWGLGTRMDRIASYAEDLYAWQQQLSQKTCAVSVPVVDPTAIPPETSQLLNLAHWGLYAVVAVAGAYGIGKVIEILPRRSPEAPSAARRLGSHVGRAKGRLSRALA